MVFEPIPNPSRDGNFLAGIARASRRDLTLRVTVSLATLSGEVLGRDALHALSSLQTATVTPRAH